MDGPEREEVDPWLGRFLVQVVLRLVRAVLSVGSYGILVFRPRLFSAWVELRKLRHRQDRAEASEFDALVAQKRVGQSAKELTYVDTPPVVGIILCGWAGVGSESSVLDLGAGRGALLLAARFFGAEARCVELLKSRVDPAAPILREVKADLFDGDIADQDLYGVTHVICTWTALSEATRQRVAEEFSRLEKGAKVLVFTFAAEQDDLRLLRKIYVPVPWGFDVVFLYEKT